MPSFLRVIPLVAGESIEWQGSDPGGVINGRGKRFSIDA